MENQKVKEKKVAVSPSVSAQGASTSAGLSSPTRAPQLPHQMTSPAWTPEKKKQNSPQILSQLENRSEDEQRAVLVLSVTEGGLQETRFKDQIVALKNAYDQVEDVPKSQEYIKNAIKAFLSAGRMRACVEDLRRDDLSAHTSTLISLSTRMNMVISPEPLVQLTIEDGKVHWRVLLGAKVLYRPASMQNFDFQKQCHFVQMNWGQFRTFKDSGKRSGTAAITQEVFSDFFKTPFLREHAKQVWLRLKEKKILNKNYRLSHAWRIGTNFSLTLSCIGKISIKDVSDKLLSLSPSQREDYTCFKNKWSSDYWVRMRHIWLTLNQRGFLDQNFQIIDAQKRRFANFLEEISLHDDQIIAALNELSRQEGMCRREVVPDPRLEIYRVERVSKQIHDTTRRIVRLKAADPSFCTKLWDVSLYKNLGRHKNKNAQGYNGPLEYDHIPSAAAMDATTDKEKAGLWAVAIPESLHRSGSTYQRTAKEQEVNTAGRHPFLVDIQTHLENIQNHCTKFGLASGDYLKALGAFRYLFRMQVKESLSLEDDANVLIPAFSNVPFAFFQARQAQNKDIDKLFLDSIKSFQRKHG